MITHNTGSTLLDVLASRRDEIKKRLRRPRQPVKFLHAVTPYTASTIIEETALDRVLRIVRIQQVVADHFNVSRGDILSARRTASVVRRRQIAMYLSKLLTPRSLPEIGRRFGGRDHTTVLHSVRKIERLIATDVALAEEIEVIRAKVMACVTP